MDEGQKRLSSDLQNLHQQVPSKNDLKPILDAIHNLQNTFDKEKSKPDILARKIDSIDQKLKDSQPEHTALMKDIQTKIDPLHKSSPQTSETLMKINDRIKAMQTDSTKPHPEILKKLDDLDQQLKNQHQHVVEPIKQVLNEKLNPLVEQQKSGLIAKKDAEDRLGERKGTINCTVIDFQRNEIEMSFSLSTFSQDLPIRLTEMMNRVRVQNVFLSVSMV